MNHKPAPMQQGGSLFSPRTLMHSSRMQAQMAPPMAFILVKPLAAREASIFSLTVYTSWFILVGKLAHLIPYIVKCTQYLDYDYDMEVTV